MRLLTDQECSSRFLSFCIRALNASLRERRLDVVVRLCQVKTRRKTLTQLGKKNFTEVLF